MRVARIDGNMISEILPPEVTTIEQATQYYGEEFASRCQVVPDYVQVGMEFLDGEWKFPPEPPVNPPPTFEELVTRVETVEGDVDEVKRGLMDISMRVS